MKTHSYMVNLIDRKGEEFTIYGPSPSLKGARNIALRQKSHRKVKLYRDNKLQPNGQFGFDKFAYELWWDEREDDSEVHDSSDG